MHLFLKERGALPTGEDHKQTTWLPTHLTHIAAADSRNYEKGDKIFFRKSVSGIGAKAGSVWTVRETHPNSNRLLLGSGDRSAPWTLRTFESRERSPFDHFRPTEIDIARNDRVRFKAKDKAAEIERDDEATILGINEKTLRVRTKDGRTLEIDRDSALAHQITHAYSMTSYAAQGKTVDYTVAASTVRKRNE